MGRRDPVPHQRRSSHRRRTPGVHPALGRPRRLDADRQRQPHRTRGSHRGDRSRALLRRGRPARRTRRRPLLRRAGPTLLGRGHGDRHRRHPARGRADRRVGGRRGRPLRRAVRRGPARGARPPVHRRGRRLPVLGAHPDAVPDPRRRPRRAAPARGRPLPAARRASALPGRPRGGAHAGDAHLPRGRSDRPERLRLRGQGVTGQALRAAAGRHPTPDGRVVAGTWSRVRFDIVLAPAGV